MSTHRLSYDPETKTEEVLHLDGTGKAVLESIQDCEDVLELNQHEAKFFDKKSGWWKIGSIPLSICFEWAKESKTRPFSHEWQEYAKKQLNMPEYAKLNVNRIRL